MKYFHGTMIDYRCMKSWFSALLVAVILVACSKEDEKRVTLLQTTDLHGVILPYDFIEKKELDVSLAAISTYVRQARKEESNVILLDNGDNLQGQPTVYYYNFIDTLSPHIIAEAMNFMKYDAGTVGNHDIEAGHPVYDRLVKEYNFPLLAANAVNADTDEPYFNPFVIIERDGIRVAVFGLITPSVPDWLPPELYSGMEFRDMLETSEIYMPLIMKEKPDLIVGLFHSGWDEPGEEALQGGHFDENGVYAIAVNVPGFDIILCGHNHNVVNTKVVNSAGDTVLIMEGGSRSEKIARADVVFAKSAKKGRYRKIINGKIIDVEKYKPDSEFIRKFAENRSAVSEYVTKQVAVFENTVSSRDSYFGPSAFVDMIHTIQMDISGAEISFAAPLSFDVKISAGPVTVGDMFKLYRYENMLYVMSMTGSEIKKYLEFSYSDWFNTMKDPDDHLLKFRVDREGEPILTNGKAWLKNQPYNFDSAAGIDYKVDISKPAGERVSIVTFSNGKKFDMKETYSVALNSYRGNGGGGHLTAGAGIPKSELVKRLIKSTDRDLRYFILKYLEDKGRVEPVANNNWAIVPEDLLKNARSKDYELLFGK